MLDAAAADWTDTMILIRAEAEMGERYITPKVFTKPAGVLHGIAKGTGFLKQG
jgi:hypothetical protein